LTPEGKTEQGSVVKPIDNSLDGSPDWIHLDLDRLPQKETLEYSIKKSLLAASAVFTLEKNLTGDILNVEGQLTAKVPFKGNFEFEATSVSRRDQSALGFSIYKEFKDDEAIRLWIEQSGLLKCIPEGEAAKRELPLSEDLEGASVLNPLTLLSVLSSHLPKALEENRRLFAAQFVAADKLFALKIQFNDAATEFLVFAKDIAAPLTSEQWLQTAWPEASMVNGRWDAEQRAVSALRVRVPVLGALELPLIRVSRE
jgi:hypothetical protein